VILPLGLPSYRQGDKRKGVHGFCGQFRGKPAGGADFSLFQAGFVGLPKKKAILQAIENNGYFSDPEANT
jgi:hypothetical protein